MMERVKVRIDEVNGNEPRYDAWSVVATAWLEREGEKKHEKKIAVNVLKDQSLFESQGDAPPRIAERVKEVYEKNMLEEESFSEISSQSLEDEKSKIDKVKDNTYEV